MAIKYLVTSGCSFSDNHKDFKRWPHHLAEAMQVRLFNYGHGSAGNDWIANSIIYGVKKLLAKRIPPEEILVMPMWSGKSRQGFFISKEETANFETLVNTGQKNPINFTTLVELSTADQRGRFVPPEKDTAGWLIGSPHCTWENNEIVRLKTLHFENFYTNEDAEFKSLNYFLQVQWFCQVHGVKLRNLSFKRILESPFKFKTCAHLYQMLDLSTWIFWKQQDGLYEYTRDNKLDFDSDHFHPAPEAHKHFAFNYLLNKVS